jgi:hypothetical protein
MLHEYVLASFKSWLNMATNLYSRLAHNQCGPHDEHFYKLWDELREEWLSLQIKGYTGEGFLSRGKQLGGRRIPVDEVRRQARAAAQQRAKENAKFTPGRVLGGAPVRGRDMRAVLADAAAKRSTNLKQSAVTSGCATGTRAGDKAAEDAVKNGFRTKAEMDDANDIAIAEALSDLMEHDEELAIEMGSPPPDGLEWSKENGLQPAKSITPSFSRSASSKLQPAPRSQQPSSTRTAPYPPPNVFIGQGQPRSAPPPPPPQLSNNQGQSATRSLPPVNPHGRPISRVVLEAEAQKKKKLSKPPPDYSKPSSYSSSKSSTHLSSREQWSCLTCTLTNEPTATQCAVCDTRRPSLSAPQSSSQVHQAFSSVSQQMGWLCNCGTFMENQWWTCSLCGTMKPNS